MTQPETGYYLCDQGCCGSTSPIHSAALHAANPAAYAPVNTAPDQMPCPSCAGQGIVPVPPVATGPRRNKLALLLTGYGSVQFSFVQYWLGFQAELAREGYGPPMYCLETAYVEQALNQGVFGLLEAGEWDYVILMEHDMMMPPGFIDRIATLDPETEKVVGALYFGRNSNDMRAVAGWLDPETNSPERLTTIQARDFLMNPGLHPVDWVGTGATAIHRSVFENWPVKGTDAWFKPGHRPTGFMGHDIGFCMDARTQGHTIWCDSRRPCPGHMGTWISTDETFLATADHVERREIAEMERLGGLAMPSLKPTT